ncbi:hypothetical protein HMPREF9141_1717 [Prevotella multiformis DSM 16608]|uniref:Uncharacterized protein n=1 Tax=Prevotella multiformis DSM 16608 TaxID=888743 RepID=F0F800_9BACT|nr:hypothetical protein HMPREF9141_1717 [Prevotella multiformis DSM 16608]
MGLNEYLPLKQGLRLLYISIKLGELNLNEYLPLKQGLRHLDLTPLRFSFVAQ